MHRGIRKLVPPLLDRCRIRRFLRYTQQFEVIQPRGRGRKKEKRGLVGCEVRGGKKGGASPQLTSDTGGAHVCRSGRRAPVCECVRAAEPRNRSTGERVDACTCIQLSGTTCRVSPPPLLRAQPKIMEGQSRRRSGETVNASGRSIISHSFSFSRIIKGGRPTAGE